VASRWRVQRLSTTSELCGHAVGVAVGAGNRRRPGGLALHFWIGEVRGGAGARRHLRQPRLAQVRCAKRTMKRLPRSDDVAFSRSLPRRHHRLRCQSDKRGRMAWRESAQRARGNLSRVARKHAREVAGSIPAAATILQVLRSWSELAGPPSELKRYQRVPLIWLYETRRKTAMRAATARHSVQNSEAQP